MLPLWSLLRCGCFADGSKAGSSQGVPACARGCHSTQSQPGGAVPPQVKCTELKPAGCCPSSWQGRRSERRRRRRLQAAQHFWAARLRISASCSVLLSFPQLRPCLAPEPLSPGDPTLCISATSSFSCPSWGQILT